MTEAEWLECKDAQMLVDFASGKASDRKLRLFACACCRQIWDQMPDSRTRNAVVIAESLADGIRDFSDLDSAHRLAQERALEVGDVLQLAAQAGVIIVRNSEPLDVARDVVRTAGLVAARMAWSDAATDDEARANAAAVWAQIASLLRHIVGNPFRSNGPPAFWPSTVTQLADALYSGQDCEFALHDALLDAGHADLAEHFSQEKWHPKGCWALDLLLGKE